MAKYTKLPKRLKTPKSTPEARRLIRAAMKKFKSERAAARALGLPNQAQLNKMRRGLIGDTPAMKIALKRAEERARRAWKFQLPLDDDGIPKLAVAALWRELKSLTKRFESLMPAGDENNSPPA